jgi:hypothetical protein
VSKQPAIVMARKYAIFVVLQLVVLVSPAVVATTSVPDPIANAIPSLQGKLFFTDQQRMQKERERKQGVEVVEGEVIPRVATLNGFMRRSDGVETYWIDGGGTSGTRIARAEGGSNAILVNAQMVGNETHDLLRGSTIGSSGADAANTAVNEKKPAKKRAKKINRQSDNAGGATYKRKTKANKKSANPSARKLKPNAKGGRG